ncbi:MAG TPA: hypothetical protein VKB19_02405 [Pedobacter sp.]|nr:hypothetical protein [Pedobacter sp.]
MGKNQNNTYIPPKGRPSGSGREGSGLKDAFSVTDLQQDNELSERYTSGEDQPAANVHMKHPNRNVDKGREDQGDETT